MLSEMITWKRWTSRRVLNIFISKMFVGNFYFSLHSKGMKSWIMRSDIFSNIKVLLFICFSWKGAKNSAWCSSLPLDHFGLHWNLILWTPYFWKNITIILTHLSFLFKFIRFGNLLGFYAMFGGKTLGIKISYFFGPGTLKLSKPLIPLISNDGIWIH